MLLTPAQIKPNPFESRRTLFLFSFFTGGGCASCLRACLGVRLLPQSYQYSNLSEGAHRVDGQLHGDKECPFSGVTKSGRVWRKVLESDAVAGTAMLGVLGGRTLRAPLSGAFLQTLPQLVTPLNGHSLSPRSCPPMLSAPSERFGY